MLRPDTAPPGDPLALIDKLMSPRAYPHAVRRIERIETHISTVLLTGDFAYKIKKPVNLGFLDFSTLDLRRHYCEEELRLNRRLAPDLYLDVVGIRVDGDSAALCAKDAAGVTEYAVKMKQFDPHALFDQLLAAGELTAAHIDALAKQLAEFHQSAPRAASISEFGTTSMQEMLLRQNFDQIRALLSDEGTRADIDEIERWSLAEHEALAAIMESRRAEGCVRECHGDLHLGNIALVNGDVRLFDGIEFNADLRWCDVMNEVAFLVMDLSARGHAELGARFLNAYLGITGDYAGVRLLRAFVVYRAMVRAKVACIRAHQSGIDDQARIAAEAEFEAYVNLARRYLQAQTPWLLVMHGVSGSGKTTISQPLLEHFAAIRLRSDLERKRLHGVDASASSGSGTGSGIYQASATELTYDALRRLAHLVLQSGWPVIVDATFQKQRQRDAFRTLAGEMKVPYVILACRADVAELKRRIAQRARQGADASEATLDVLERQLRDGEPLTAEERLQCIAVDTASDDIGNVFTMLKARIAHR